MREQTWHDCQAVDGLAKARSRASPSPPHDPELLFAPYMLHRSRQKPPALHAPPFTVDRSREGLHREHRPSTRRRPLPILTDSIAQKLPPHAPPSTADREQHHRAETPRAAAMGSSKARNGGDLIGDRTTAIQLAARVPGRAKKSTAWEGTVTTRHTKKNRIRVHFG